MPFTTPALVSDILSFIEECEQRLQNWGFYDVAFDETELAALIATEASDEFRADWEEYELQGGSLGSLLTQMRHADLLHLVPDNSGRIRSRFAEGIRLLVNLRQRFSHLDWASAPRLVSDVKIHLAPRRYPTVEIPAAGAWALMAPNARQLGFQEKAFTALASRPGGQPFAFAGFQVRSFERIFRAYNRDEESGTVVCATTGAGKTKAFYIPAFTAIAAEIGKPADRFTKVIAIYPRNVLLADQLREAVAEAAKLTPLLKANGKRPITVGALLGSLPPAGQFEVPNSPFLIGWRYVRGQGWIVPFLRAPFHPGRGELIWRDVDRKAGRTVLYRADALDGPPEVPDGVIQLSREGLQDNPPDILFLSLEMMQRELGNPLWAKTFGISAEEKPRLLLFDEVHNYSGLSGAQAPWIIARWRQAARLKKLHVVGLSATLRDAPNHLATIGCVNPERVVECTPLDTELVPEGRDYTVLVKGDPASGGTLLATSIQAAMLQARLLTPVHEPYPPSSSAAGQSLYLRKVFGFADQLDSLNRWLPDLRDAERKRLAQYRSPPIKSGQTVSVATEREMIAQGQIWTLPDRLGHDLNQGVRVTRCSSQDPGADAASDIIVATASLEVGFDDPDVGAVIQHKAPRSIASFLQRRGRAGRTRGSRPTTLVILSDAGRDRWLFQNSERVFQAEVESIKVPMLNPYVQHVQATSFMLDWLGRRVGLPDPVRYLRSPKGSTEARRRAVDWLRKLLELGEVYTKFHRELGWVVRLTQRYRTATPEEIDRVVDDMLWEAPRPVLRHAAPALLRKLQAEWRLADPSRGGSLEDSDARQPLPAFIPSASFADLAASDVHVDFPGLTKLSETRGATQQFIESCPGRVSKRFSVNKDEVGYWLEGSDALLNLPSPVVLPVLDLFPDSIAIGTGPSSQAYQPVRMSLVSRPSNVKDSSNASWAWVNNADFIGDGRPLALLAHPEWQAVFGGAHAYLHGDLNSVLVRRRTSEGRFDILMKGGGERRGAIILGSTSSSGDVVREHAGFEQTVDALVFQVREGHLNARPDLDEATMGRLRQAYFRHLLLNSPVLREAASSFTLDSIWQSSLAMLAATALKNGTDFAGAQALVDGRRLPALGQVLSRMFSASALDDGDEDHEAGGKARDRLEALWADAACAAEICRAEEVLWRPLDAEFETWLQQRHLRTLAEACLSAVQTVATDVGESDLVVDVIEGERGPQIVISETAPGGIGQIEAFVQSSLDDEGAFERAVSHALHFCPREHVSENLLGVVKQARRVGPIADAFATVRNARGYPQQFAAQAALADALEGAGFSASRESVVAVMGRVLRPGSSRHNDAWVDGLNRTWVRLAAQLGAPIEPRVFAYLMVDNQSVHRRLSALVEKRTGQKPAEAQLFARAQEFLQWGCRDSCPQCLSNTNRFVAELQPSRELTNQWLAFTRPSRPTVSVGPGWFERLTALLATEDRVEIVGREGELPEISAVLQSLIARRFERDYLQLFPFLSAVTRDRGGEWRVCVEIRNGGAD